MKKSIRIGMVSYTNCLPYAWAFERLAREEKFILEIDRAIPADVAARYHKGAYDLCILPVAGMLKAPVSELSLFPYGIACDGAVFSVCLFSDTPLEEIKTIYLDKESRTSNLLMRILDAFYLKKNIRFLPAPAAPHSIRETEGLVAIGDKALEKSRYAYAYDLGALWKTYADLPFVFAHWVYKKDVDASFLEAMRKNIDTILVLIKTDAPFPPYNSLSDSIKTYLSSYIKYAISPSMYKGLEKFYALSEKIPPAL